MKSTIFLQEGGGGGAAGTSPRALCVWTIGANVCNTLHPKEESDVNGR